MFLIAALLFFAVFTLNVVMGSFWRAPFLGDVEEMLTLFAASIAFVAAVLVREAARQRTADNNQREELE